MQIKMLEYFQGSGITAVDVASGGRVPTLEPERVYEVDDDLGNWLIGNRKAKHVTASKKTDDGQTVPPFGAEESQMSNVPERTAQQSTAKTTEPNKVETSKKAPPKKRGGK